MQIIGNIIRDSKRMEQSTPLNTVTLLKYPGKDWPKHRKIAQKCTVEHDLRKYQKDYDINHKNEKKWLCKD